MDVGERRVLWSRARLQSACGQAGSHWRCFIKYAFSTLRVAPCRGLSADPWHTHETNSIKRQTKTQNARLLYYVAEIINGHKKIVFPISRRLKAISWSIVKIRQELVPFKYLHVLRWSVRYADYTDSRSNYSALKQSALRLSSSRLANWRTKSYEFTNNKRYFGGSRFSISFIVLSVHQCIPGKDYYTFELIFITSFCGRRTGHKPVDLQSANTQRRDPRAKANLLRVICQ